MEANIDLPQKLSIKLMNTGDVYFIFDLIIKGGVDILFLQLPLDMHKCDQIELIDSILILVENSCEIALWSFTILIRDRLNHNQETWVQYTVI